MDQPSPQPVSQQPFLFETISAVRQDPLKRSVPVDLATYLYRESRFAEARARVRLGIGPTAEIPDGAMDHVHLLGDALVAAENIAEDCYANSNGGGNVLDPSLLFRTANERLKDLFSGGSTNEHDKELQTELGPLVDEKRRLVMALAEMFGLRMMRVVSAIDFIRERGEIRDRIDTTLVTVFAGVQHKIEISQCEKVINRIPVDQDHFGTWMSWGDLARSTLPRSRLTGDTLQQMCKAYYGTTEGGIHAGVIEMGGEVATYSGSEQAGAPPAKIIENMRRLVELALYYSSRQETKLATAVHSFLSIRPELDGLGIFRPQEGGENARPTDPFTIAHDANTGEFLIPQKLPLLIFERGQLRAATAAEVESVVIDSSVDSGGGVTGVGGKTWRHNLGAVVRLFAADGGRLLDDSKIKGAMRRHNVPKDVLREWIDAVVQNMDALPSQPKKQHCLVPGGKAGIVGALVEAVAGEVIERMKKIEKKEKNLSDGETVQEGL